MVFCPSPSTGDEETVLTMKQPFFQNNRFRPIPGNACIHQGSNNVVTVGDGLYIEFSIGVKKMAYRKSYGNDRHRPSPSGKSPCPMRLCGNLPDTICPSPSNGDEEPVLTKASENNRFRTIPGKGPQHHGFCDVTEVDGCHCIKFSIGLQKMAYRKSYGNDLTRPTPSKEIPCAMRLLR